MRSNAALRQRWSCRRFSIATPSHDGIVAFFDALFERDKSARKERVALQLPAHERHHVLSGARRSSARAVSRNDRRNEGQLERRALTKLSSSHAIRIKQCLPGSESSLLAAKARGVAGCISGSVALWPELAQAVFASGDRMQDEELTRRRAALDGMPFIAAVRYLTAAARNDPAWERAMPPNVPLTPQQRQALVAAAGRMPLDYRSDRSSRPSRSRRSGSPNGPARCSSR